MLKRRIFLVSFLILALTLSGCFGGSALKEITISASADEVEQGKSITLAVKGVDKKKKEVTVPNPKWELSDETKGKLSADGVNATFEAGKEATGKVVIKVSSGKLSDEITIKIIEAKKDPEPTPVDKNDLASAIQEAETILNDTGKGNEPGQAPEEAHTALADAIAAAQVICDTVDATQTEVDEAVTTLLAAIDTFNAAIVKEEPPGEDGVIFRETFNNVPDGTNIRKEPDMLDNPESISHTSGTLTVIDGVLEMGSQRFTIEVPGLATAGQPVLKITIKNDNGSGLPVNDLKLAVGNKESTSGAVGVDGYRAHGEYPITFSEFKVLEIELNKEHTVTGQIQFRGIVGSKGTAGLFIDQIEVWDTSGNFNPGQPSDPEEPGEPTDPQEPEEPSDPDPDPQDPNPDIPTEPPPTIGDAYFGLVGWASENGGTTGGEGCPENKILFIDNGRDLYDALYANERRHKGDKNYGEPYPLIIYITGKITPENTGKDKFDIKDQSDVSIIGYGDQGEFHGIGISLRRAENIIIRNLTIHNVDIGEKKAIDVTTNSKNIWIDRCTFYSDRDHKKDHYDGLVDIKEGAEYVTVSWCKFFDHYKTSLIGHTDDASKAPDKVTYHHNYFYNVNSRTPLIRYAEVHLFNNYFHNITESGINVRMGGKARIENNYFESVGNGNLDDKTGYREGPIGWWYGSSQTGYWEVIDNIFVDCPVSEYESTTSVHIPYDYSMALNDAERAKELVLQYAGAGSPSLEL